MIAYLNGFIAYKDDEKVIIDVSGVGYEAGISSSTTSRLPDIGNEIKLYIYHHFREDGEALFGFMTQEDKAFFIILISMSGMGPKTALKVMGQTDPGAFSRAVQNGDLAYLSSISGIGKKTAERIIVELKDKFETFTPTVATQTNTAQTDAIDALISLGFSPPLVRDVVGRVVQQDRTLPAEAVIRQALQMMG